MVVHLLLLKGSMLCPVLPVDKAAGAVVLLDAAGVVIDEKNCKGKLLQVGRGAANDLR